MAQFTGTPTAAPISTTHEESPDVPAKFCRYEDYRTHRMSMLPNCPQVYNKCLMHDGMECDPIPACPRSCPNNAAIFLGSESYVEPNDLSIRGQSHKCKIKHDTNTKPVAYNFYKLPDGTECFKKVKDSNPAALRVPKGWSSSPV